MASADRNFNAWKESRLKEERPATPRWRVELAVVLVLLVLILWGLLQPSVTMQ